MRTNKLSQLITVILLFLVMSCVAANGKYRKLSRAEIQAVLKEIGSQPNAAIHQQANDGSISLFALGGHRKTDFGGCLADEYVVELSPSSEEWRVDSHDKFLKLSLAPCGAKKDSDFFEVDGQYSSKMIKKHFMTFFFCEITKFAMNLFRSHLHPCRR
jgi:hypothetical protein